MIESLQMMADHKLRPEILITHIGGLDSVIYATENLPGIPGGKKLIYTHINMELTAISDFQKKGTYNPVYKKLYEICEKNDGLWSIEAEKYLLENSDNL